MTRRATERRAGFSLVEIMVVIVIIAILAALLLPVLTSTIKSGQVGAARSEIAQVDVSIAAARRDLGYGGVDLPFIPSALVLCDNWSHYTTPPMGTADDIKDLLQPSQIFLQKMFGKNIGASGTGHLSGNLDWNGNGTVDNPTLLLGDQVLWFILGGIPSGGGASGFASNPADPTMTVGSSGAGNRKGPYFDFAPGRLVTSYSYTNTSGTTQNIQFVPWNGNSAMMSTWPTSNGFFLYLDFYKKQPYIYLSAYGGAGYNFWVNTYCTQAMPTVGPKLTSEINAYAGYNLTSPYTNSTTSQAINPNTYQLISAGADGVFGAGGSWNPATGYPTGGGAVNHGVDDLANFARSTLGRPAN